MEKYRALIYYEASILKGWAHNNDSKSSQDFISTRPVKSKSPDVILLVKNELVVIRNELFGTTSITRLTHKISVQADLSREAYSQPVVGLGGENEFQKNEV